MKKWIISGGVILIFLAFMIWLFMASSKPLLGIKMADLGRKHVPAGEAVEYNSNPPTSGPHYEDWIRAGVYETPKDDRNLVHSLEHGYVIMSYNCEKKVVSSQSLFISTAYAHGLEEEEEASPSSEEASPSAELSEDCHTLVDQLISIYEKKGKTRLIVVPRPNLDARIALTAWNYIDKLGTFDEERIVKFIDAHLNQGPEKTVETVGK